MCSSYIRMGNGKTFPLTDREPYSDWPSRTGGLFGYSNGPGHWIVNSDPVWDTRCKKQSTKRNTPNGGKYVGECRKRRPTLLEAKPRSHSGSAQVLRKRLVPDNKLFGSSGEALSL